MANPLIQAPLRRPILTTVIYLVVVTVGFFSLLRLPIDLMPEITFPTISVSTSYEGAGPQEIEDLVTRPIESAVAGIQGIEQIASTSTEGSSRVRVAFTWGTDLEEATNDVRDRIDRIVGRLPEDCDRPVLRKFDLSAFPILIMGVSSHLEPVALRELIQDQVQYRLERVPGVASVDIRGGAQRVVHVALRSEALNALRVTPDMVAAALQSENRNMPAGSVDQGAKTITVRTMAEYGTLEEIRDAVVEMRDGVAVRLRDVAEVIDGGEDLQSLVRINGEPGITMSVSKQSGANTVAVARGIRRELRALALDLPQIRITSLIDTSRFIESSIRSVGVSLALGGLFSVLVLLLFLRNISSTLIIATVIPISVIATFGLVYFAGLTLNMMTFGGLALGIGMLVDCAIVVLDSIFHRREQGGTPAGSAVEGASEVASAVTASTLTTLVVFIPVVFIRGMSGVMFQQLAAVVAFAISCSLIAAITLIPLLTSRFLHMPAPGAGLYAGLMGALFARSERAYAALEQGYGALLQSALRRRPTVFFGGLGVFALSLALLPLVGAELMPTSDESEVRVELEMEVGTRLEVLDTTVRQVERIVGREVPEARYVIANSGGGGWGATRSHTGSVRVALVPPGKRSRSTGEIAAALRRKLAGIAGTTVRVREGQGLFILRMGMSQGQSVSIEVRGHDLEAGQDLARQVADAVEKVTGVTDTRISREEGMPERRIRVDRRRAADAGLTPAAIGSAIQIAMGGTQATTFRTGGKEYPVIVRLAESERESMGSLANMWIRNRSGVAIPLGAVADLQPGSGPVQIERTDRERVVTVEANYAGTDLGSVVRGIRAAIAPITVPPDFAILVRGDYEEQQEAFRELLFGLLLAIALVYLVMAGQFESWRDPFIVLFSVPMALIGVVLILLLTVTPFSVQAYIGMIILAGIVVNNAIVLVDTVNRYRRERGMSVHDALVAAGVRRLRPILMTASTTVLGLLPLSLALGEGGEAQAPMARAVVGGLLASTVISLVLVPVVYSLLEEHQARKRARAAARP